MVGPTVVYATLGLGEAMLVLVGLSFLGLGAQPPTPEWGLMISDAQQYYDHWWLALFPGLCIMSVVFCLNIIGDRVRNSLDRKDVDSMTAGSAGHTAPILRVEDLQVVVRGRRRPLRVVDGFPLDVFPGRVAGVAGERKRQNHLHDGRACSCLQERRPAVLLRLGGAISLACPGGS